MKKLRLLDILVFSLSIYLLISLVLQSVMDIGAEANKLFLVFDFVACVIFLIDWITRFLEAESKKKFLFNIINFLDLLASIPFLALSNYVGYFKLIRLLRILKIIKSTVSIINRNKSALDRSHLLKTLFLVIFIAVVIISPILILLVESEVGNIKTAEDAVWWTYCTMSTIGYGDRYPVTGVGRLITVFVSIGGISLFGLATGMFANYFLTENNHEKSKD